MPAEGSGPAINNGGTVTIDDSTGTANCGNLYVGYGTADGGPGLNGAVTIPGGVLNVTQWEEIGVGSLSRSGFFSQSGGLNGTTGTFFYLGDTSNGVGSFQLSGTGQLIAAVEFLGYSGGLGAISTGTFLQTGGTNGDA